MAPRWPTRFCSRSPTTSTTGRPPAPARRCHRRSRGCRAAPRRSRRRSRSAGTGRPRRRAFFSRPRVVSSVSARSSASVSSPYRERRRSPRPGTASALGMLVSVTVSSPYSLGRTVGSAGFPGPAEVAGAHGHVCTGSFARGRAVRGRFRPGAGRTAAARCRNGPPPGSRRRPCRSALPLGGAALLRVVAAWRPASAGDLGRGRLGRRAGRPCRPNRPPDLAGCTGLRGGGGAAFLAVTGGGNFRSTHCCWPRVKRLLVTQ